MLLASWIFRGMLKSWIDYETFEPVCGWIDLLKNYWFFLILNYFSDLNLGLDSYYIDPYDLSRSSSYIFYKDLDFTFIFSRPLCLLYFTISGVLKESIYGVSEFEKLNWRSLFGFFRLSEELTVKYFYSGSKYLGGWSIF